MADLSGVTTNFFATAQEGFTTTTSSSTASGATTVALNGMGDYVDGDVVALTIEPASASAKQVFTGVVSGLNVTNVKWTEGTNQVHAAGSTVIDYVSATHQAMQTKGNLVHSNPDGTLKAGSVVSSTISDNSVTTSKVNDGAVTKAKLERPHYNAMFYTTGGPAGGQVVTASEVLAGFDTSDTVNGYGITATIVGSYLTVVRDGLYNLTYQVAASDGSPSTGFICWFEISIDNGANYFRFRNYDRNLTIGTGQLYSMQTWLPANARVRMFVYNGTGGIRLASPSDTTLNGRYFTGPKLTVAEIR